MTLSQWYDQGDKVVEISTGTAVWYSKGLPTVPLRWVLVRDSQHKLTPQAFLCTDKTIKPEQILTWFIRRWQLEVTFEEARAHLAWKHSGIGPIVPLHAPRQ